MRAWSIPLAACCCAALLAACGFSASKGFEPKPGEHFSVTQKANPGGTLSDLASQVTTDTLLRYRGAKLQKAEPFAPCPGEAGEQTFTIPGRQGGAVLHVAFTQWNGTEKLAAYQHPAKASDDAAAMEALRKIVCTNPLG